MEGKSEQKNESSQNFVFDLRFFYTMSATASHRGGENEDAPPSLKGMTKEELDNFFEKKDAVWCVKHFGLAAIRLEIMKEDGGTLSPFQETLLYWVKKKEKEELDEADKLIKSTDKTIESCDKAMADYDEFEKDLKREMAQDDKDFEALMREGDAADAAAEKVEGELSELNARFEKMIQTDDN